MKKESRLILWIAVVSLLLVPLLDAALVDPSVVAALEKQDEVPVIVTLRDSSPETTSITSASPPLGVVQLREEVKEQQEEVLNKLDIKSELNDYNDSHKDSYNFDLDHQFSTINGFSGKVTEEALDTLLADPNVKSIVYDRPIRLALDVSGPLINADDVRNITFNGQNMNGTGETVCVVDTGVDYTHTALGGCNITTVLAGTCSVVIGGADVADSDNDPLDGNGHGTHVAGIVASRDSVYSGIAPGAKLVAVKVFPGTSGTTTTSNAIAGFDWCRNNATLFNISVITSSLGDSVDHTTACDDDSLASAANTAANAGLFVTAASGNNGFTDGINSPACASNVTSVGRVGDSDVVFSTSNGGSILDILAPGTSIRSLALGSGFVDNSGTSMSSPHVAGAAAIYIQYWKRVYGITPTVLQIETKMKRTGKQITDTRNSLAFPRIDILAAVQPLINFTSNSAANNSTTGNTFALINITSDINITHSLLQWNYTNGTIRNLTMTRNNLTNYHLNVTGLSNANYSYRVFGNDSANSIGQSVERILHVDLVPPEITFTTPANSSYHRQALTMSVTIIDSFSLSFSNYSIRNASGGEVQNGTNSTLNTSSFTWSSLINVSNSTFPEGNYTLLVFANDSVNNSNSSSITFIVDKSAPTIFNHNRTPETIFNNDTVVIHINTTDRYLNTSAIFMEANYSGTATNYSMTLESGDLYNVTIRGTTNLSNNGNISYVIHTFDLAGNKNTSETFSFVVKNHAPSGLTITFPSNGTVIEVGNTTRFNATATDVDGDSLTYIWNFSDRTSSVSQQNTTHQFNFTDTLVVVVNVTDGVNSTLANITVIINDTQAPATNSIGYNSEHHLQRNGASQNVNVSLFDYSGMANASLTFNGTLQTRTCTDANTTWNCSWAWNSLSVGSYNFTVNATDNFTTRHTNSTTYSFTVTSCSDSSQNGDETGVDCGGSCSTSCSSGSSGSTGAGGGGGGGGGSTTTTSVEVKKPVPAPISVPTTSPVTETVTKEESKVVEEAPLPTTVSQQVSLVNGKTSVVKISDNKISIDEITINSKTDKSVTLDVVYHPVKPVAIPALDNTYQYLEIVSQFNKEDMDGATVTFNVPVSWLTANGFVEDSVKLQTLEAEIWSPLKTRLISLKDDHYVYQAKLEHLSYFAITATTKKPLFNMAGYVLIGLLSLIILLLIIYLIVRKRT